MFLFASHMLHRPNITAHISEHTTKCPCHICATNKYAPLMSYLCHTTKLFNANYSKSVLSRPPHLLKIKLSKITPFKTITHSQCEKFYKSVLSSLQHPPKVKRIQNQSFQVHYTLPMWKLPKMSPYETTIISQSELYPKSVLSIPAHPPPSEQSKISAFKPTKSPKDIKILYKSKDN